jgi:general secretion pathway protein A
MEYYEILHLRREPFSNSPDPDFFYLTPGYQECLQKLEIAIRLRRGLNVVLGEVGTGKTTLSRVLLKTFESDRERFRVHLLLDPGFQSDQEMLAYLLRLFGGQPGHADTVTDLKDRLQHVLLEQGVHEGRTMVLLIDEGQKLSPSALEILRELLNFESNESKLLQVVVFAQMELWGRIQGMDNLLDRVNLIMRLRPLTLHETRAMIHHRLAQAGMPVDRPLFTAKAMTGVHQVTGGHPRKIITLCHHAMLRALILQHNEVTHSEVNEASREVGRHAWGGVSKSSMKGWGWVAAGLLLAAVALLGDAQWRTGDEGAVEAAKNPPEEATSPASSPEPSPPAEPERRATLGDEPQPVREWPPEAWFGTRMVEREGLDSGATIMVRKGDTLSGIVEKHYGVPMSSRLLEELQRANPTLANPHLLSPGKALILPPLRGESRGVYSEALGWFPEIASAERWAKLQAEDADVIFVTRAGQDETRSYGVLKGLLKDRDDSSTGGGSALVWVGQDEVLRVFGRPVISGGKEDR